MSAINKVRVMWAGMRYSLWLDLYCVRWKHRGSLRRDLESNLRDAAGSVGMRPALANLGSLRHLAAETSSEGGLRSSWVAATVAAIFSFLGLFASWMLAVGYYTEGVLDGGTGQRVSSWLFPFVGSSITVHNTRDNGGTLKVSMNPGIMLVVVLLVVFVLVARPWRVLLDRKARPCVDR
jgi:hypothetical protein